MGSQICPLCPRAPRSPTVRVPHRWCPVCLHFCLPGGRGWQLLPGPCLSVPWLWSLENIQLWGGVCQSHHWKISRDPLALKCLGPGGLCCALGKNPGPGLSPCSSWPPAGHDSDSDSELSLDEQSSSYASSHSSDSEDDGLEAEDKWDPAPGPVHSTPKGEGAGTAGQNQELGSVKDRPGGGAGREGAPASPPTRYRHACLGADPTCYGESQHKAPGCWGAAGGIAA